MRVWWWSMRLWWPLAGATLAGLGWAMAGGRLGVELALVGLIALTIRAQVGRDLMYRLIAEGGAREALGDAGRLGRALGECALLACVALMGLAWDHFGVPIATARGIVVLAGIALTLVTMRWAYLSRGFSRLPPEAHGVLGQMMAQSFLAGRSDGMRRHSGVWRGSGGW